MGLPKDPVRLFDIAARFGRPTVRLCVRNGGHAIRWSHLAPTALCVVVVAIHVTLGPEMHQNQGMTKAIYDPASPYGVRLSRVPKPSRCNNGMMIIQVEAAALNPVDFKVLQLPAALPLVWLLLWCALD